MLLDPIDFAAASVSETVCAFAPGYDALTMTVGNVDLAPTIAAMAHAKPVIP